MVLILCAVANMPDWLTNGPATEQRGERTAEETNSSIPGRGVLPSGRPEFDPCDIFGGHSGTGTGLSPSTSFPPPPYIIPSMLHTRIYYPPVGDAV
jgi:hypothetical protein